MTDPERFGAFDGRFLGISLNLERPLEDGTLPWLSPASLDVASAAPLISKVEPSAPFAGLLATTSLTHELRHFHDFMLSPLGAYVVRSRCLAAANTVPLLFWLAQQDGVVPIPLNTWIKMTPQRRDAFWARASRLFAANGQRLGQPLEVPHSPTIELPQLSVVPDVEVRRQGAITSQHLQGDSLRLALLPIANQFARAESVLEGAEVAGDLWTPGQVFETNALMTQLQHLRLVTNPDVSAGLASALRDRQSSYSTVVERIGALLGQRLPDGSTRFSGPEVTALGTYALLGNCDPSWRGQAIARFAVVASHLHTRGIDEKPIRDQYSEWDELLEEKGWLTAPAFASIEDSLALDADLERTLAADEPPRAEDVSLAVKITCRDFLAARRRLCTRFLEDPDSYVRPKTYLAQLPQLPRPAVRVSSPEGNGEAIVQCLRAAGWDGLRQMDGSGVLGSPSAELLPGHESFRLDALQLTTELLMASEMVFADNPAVTEAGGRFLRDVFKDRIPMVRIPQSG